MAWTNNDNDEIEIANIDKDQYPQEKLSTDPFQRFKENGSVSKFWDVKHLKSKTMTWDLKNC